MDVIWSDKEEMTYQQSSGKPKQILIDKEANYSVLLHEYTHAIDDYESGGTKWKG